MIISEFGLVDISRKHGARFIKKYGLKENLDQILGHCLPFGQPAPESVKYVHLNEETYLTYMRTYEEDKGLALIINISNPLEADFNPLNYLESMKQYVEQNDDTNANPQLGLNSKKNALKSYSLENIDTAIYSLLTKQKIYSVGSHEEVLELINIILEILPTSMIQKIDFTSQTNSFSENTLFSGLQLTHENLEHLDAIRNEKNTIIFFPNKTCYGIYSSPITKTLSELFEEGNFSQAKSILDRFINQAIAEPDIDIDPITTAQKYKFKISDAVLLLQIRGVLYNKAIPPKIFDKLVT